MILVLFIGRPPAVRVPTGVPDLVVGADVLGEEAVLFGQRGRHLKSLAPVARQLPVELVERPDPDDLLVAVSRSWVHSLVGCSSSCFLHMGSVSQRLAAAS